MRATTVCGVSDHSSARSCSSSPAQPKKVLSRTSGPNREAPGCRRSNCGRFEVAASVLRALRRSFCMKNVASPCQRLTPVRVTTLMSPPAAPPNSAPALMPATRNSCTISSPTATRLPPVVSSRLSTPSMLMPLLRGRMPAKVNPLSASGLRMPVIERCCPPPADCASPGASDTKPR